MTPTRQDSLVQGELKGKVYLFNMICQSSPDLSILVTMTKHTQTFDEFLKVSPEDVTSSQKGVDFCNTEPSHKRLEKKTLFQSE